MSEVKSGDLEPLSMYYALCQETQKRNRLDVFEKDGNFYQIIMIDYDLANIKDNQEFAPTVIAEVIIHKKM